MPSKSIPVAMLAPPGGSAGSSSSVWVQLNDQLVRAAEARVSVFDRGFMYGDGVFETLRSYSGCVFRLSSHLERFQRSASALGITIPRPRTQIVRDIETLVEMNGAESKDLVIRISLSRGQGRRGPGIAGVWDPTYVVSTGELPKDLPERQINGVRLAIVEIRRVGADALPSHAKHANYLNSILAHTEAVAAGADDALLLTSDQMLAECSGSNLFVIHNGQVSTPDLGTGILGGIARGVVLELCVANDIDCKESRLGVGLLDDAEEIFITNSVTEIVPVQSIDGRQYPLPGPATARIQELFGNFVRLECSGR
jgi:branched-chain amino acid aminotransferase